MHAKGAIMNCEEIGKLLTTFHHGELSDEEDKLVEKHIASCSKYTLYIYLKSMVQN